MSDELHQIVGRYRMESRVHFAGFVTHDEFLGLLPEHHLFIQPSITASDGDSEGGHPVALTQAAASGMPIIATRHDDIPEIVADRVNGWLVSERNVDEIVIALKRPCAIAAD
ncbi:MAG TPA: glycosyltransferase [Thermoanaerobaculia bacterium]